ncbi:MAG: uracil-DNA glycosylase [Verrucomicrobiae bacterium]|nr:uracil-DNA glycosylase [Verrucomicrobiae bacterium]NNJ42885.1 uracil-DNA glycosylase [Akkermansiaceae bacterium]
MSAAPVIDYLRQLESQGQTHVNIDDEARLILREFYLRARGGAGQRAAPVIRAAAPQESPVVELPSMPVAESADVAESAPQLVATGATAAEKIMSLKQQVASWGPIRELDSLRQTMVFSMGNPEADVMLVGEAPGYDEERLGEPFVGKAGQKLDGILKAMGLSRRDVYMTSVVKYRPSMPNQTTNNRKPTRQEMDACMPFVHEEVKVVAPRVIIVLGVTPAQALLGGEGTVESLRGEFHRFEGVPVRVTYHPSYILHNEETAEKRKLWEDMLNVMDMLEMAVSEKQRGYFLSKPS